MICLKYAQMQFYKLIYNSISRLVKFEKPTCALFGCLVTRG